MNNVKFALQIVCRVVIRIFHNTVLRCDYYRKCKKFKITLSAPRLVEQPACGRYNEYKSINFHHGWVWSGSTGAGGGGKVSLCLYCLPGKVTLMNVADWSALSPTDWHRQNSNTNPAPVSKKPSPTTVDLRRREKLIFYYSY